MTDEDALREAEALDDAALEALAAAVTTPPPARLRDRVLARVGTEAAAQKHARQARGWRVASGLALAACVVLALVWSAAVRDRSGREVELLRLERERDALTAKLEAREADLALVDESLDVQTELVRILAAPRLLTATLIPRGAQLGHARVLLDPDTGAVAVIGKGLPAPDSGRTYELWALRDTEPPVSAGRLDPGAAREGSFALRLRTVSDPAAVREFVISMEPEQGGELPSGPVILAGRVAR